MALKGTHLSLITKQKLRIAHLGKPKRYGKDNHSWKDNNATDKAIRLYMRKRMEKPAVCPICGLKKELHFYNITGIFKRDPKNWQWRCRPLCHVIIDRGPLVPCLGCGKLKLQNDKRGRKTNYHKGHHAQSHHKTPAGMTFEEYIKKRHLVRTISNHLCENGCGKFTRHDYRAPYEVNRFCSAKCSLELFNKLNRRGGFYPAIWKTVDPKIKLSLHSTLNWIWKHLSKPVDGKCEICKKKPFRQILSLSGEYRRNQSNPSDLSDFQWVCHRCCRNYEETRTSEI